VENNNSLGREYGIRNEARWWLCTEYLRINGNYCPLQVRKRCDSNRLRGDSYGFTMRFPISRCDYNRLQVPGDGDCLITALYHGLGLDADQIEEYTPQHLRRQIVFFLLEFRKEIMDMCESVSVCTERQKVSDRKVVKYEIEF